MQTLVELIGLRQDMLCEVNDPILTLIVAARSNMSWLSDKVRLKQEYSFLILISFSHLNRQLRVFLFCCFCYFRSGWRTSWSPWQQMFSHTPASCCPIFLCSRSCGLAPSSCVLLRAPCCSWVGTMTQNINTWKTFTSVIQPLTYFCGDDWGGRLNWGVDETVVLYNPGLFISH